MYNEQVKQAFAQEYSVKATTRKLVLFIFDALSEYEETYGADFAMFDEEQTHTAANAVAGFRSNNAAAILYILKDYVRWCKKNGHASSDAIFSAKIDVVEKFRASMVGNPQHLRMSLDAVFPHPENNEIEYVYRSFLWLAFLGFDDDEAICVRQSEIDFDEMKINFAGNLHPYQIYPEAVSDLRKATQLIEFYEPRGKNGVYKERVSGDFILRGKKPEKPMEDMLIKTLRPMVSRAFKTALQAYEEQGIKKPDELSLNLSFKHIYMSGVFYRAYERERIGIPVTFVGVVEHETSSERKDDKKYGKNYSLNKRRNVMIRGYMNDYKCWKAAFSPQ